ncbi:formyltransferase family protein [Altibacter sp.]|uniref:methionyl-tRNA formyltransferase n=1 Tax=Altibacter sp. TaxID=2024823 RepID=UPI0025844182|nr:formyltransferase family protein [Altibacter sp.]MCW9036334.1 formyltransferase family protein [Altibacter sp.]
MKVTCYVLGEKGYSALKALQGDSRAVIDTVVIGTDPALKDDHSKKIEAYCEASHLNATYDDVPKDSSNVLIAMGWRRLIHPLPHQQLIVLHDSLLPKYRGFNPLVTALIEGDTEIGVTAILGAEAYDTGAIIAVEKISVTYPITIAEAIHKISQCYGTLLQHVLEKVLADELRAVPQEETEASYSLWRDEKDYFVQWDWPAAKIQRMIDAVGPPYDGAKTWANGKQIRLIQATVVADVSIVNRDIGKVLFKDNGKPVVVCGEGLLRLDQIAHMDFEPLVFETLFRIRFGT